MKGSKSKRNNIKDIQSGCEMLVFVCADLHPQEKALVISDEITYEVGEAIVKTAQTVSGYVKHITIKPFEMHGMEPPLDVANEMLRSSVIFGVTKMSMAHTLARKKASLGGSRYLSLADYSLDLLESPALQVDFKKITPVVQRVTDILSEGEKISVKTKMGTDLLMYTNGRKANCCPGWCLGPGTLASPPDIESNIAPLEDKSEGIIVIDGSVLCRELGLLKKPIILEVKCGQIVKISGELADILEKCFDFLQNAKTRILGEIGFGFNPKAKLKGVMLEDEGCLGTSHLGFGSNSTMGGKNQVPFHLDMVIRYPTVLVNGHAIFKEGVLVNGL